MAKEKPLDSDPAKNSRKISLLYFLFGSLWIVISDIVKSYTERETIIHFSTDAAKGVLFIVVTAVLLNYFLKKYFTRIKDTNLEIKERENEYKTLAERLNIGIIKQLPDGTYIYMNPMAKHILNDYIITDAGTDVNGLKPEDIYSDKEILARVNETISYVAENKQRLLRKTKYGSRYFSFNTYPELDLNGNVLSILSIIADETDVMESMLKLEESEKFNSLLVNSSYVIVYLNDISKGTNIFANNALSSILGYTPDEIRGLGKNFEEKIMHPDDKQALNDYITNRIPILKDGEIAELEYRMKHKDGKYRWIKSSDKVFTRDSNGNPEIILGYGIEVTELKNSRDELKKYAEYLNTIIEVSPIAFLNLDTDGKVLNIWNKAAENIFGWEKNEVIGKKLPVIPQTKIGEFEKFIGLLSKGESINGREFLRQRKDGSPVYVRVYAKPLRNKNGNVESILSYIEDLTLEKKFEETTKQNEKYLKILYEASLKASNTFNNHDLYKECFTYIDDIIDVTSIMVSLVSEDNKSIIYDAVRVNGEDIDAANIPLMKLDKNSRGPLTRTIIEGTSRVIEDLEESAKSSKNKFFIDTDGKLQDLSSEVINVSRSAIMIPLKYADKVIGVLQVQNVSTGVYSERDLLKLEPFAFIFASAINRSRLYTKLQNELAEKAAAFDQVRKFYTGIEQSPNSIVITNGVAEIEYVNPYFTELTGYSLEEAIGKNPKILQSGHTSKDIYRDMWQKLYSNEVWHGEFLNRKKNGELFWEAAAIGPIYDSSGKVTHYIAIKQDITDKKKKDKELQDSLHEKEIMLKEIHHRVKNNLQVISSLLNMQVEQYEHPEAIEAINSSRNRVKAMALVHESLYQSRNIGKTDFKEYIIKLAKNIYSSYGVSMDRVQLKIDSNAIEFGLDTIIPLGLILNEAISNCLKHAFPGDTAGEISLELTREKIEENDSGRNENFRLEIKDTGKGLPDNFDPYTSNSLGMTLLTSLSAQLDGEAFFVSSNGTKIVINFKELTYTNRM